MKQLAQGSYSEVCEHDGIVIKFIEPGTPSDAQQRCSDVRQYCALLQQAGVRMPHTDILVVGSHLLVIMELVPGKDAFRQARALGESGDVEELYTLFSACCAQVVCLVKALHHEEQPVGYDACPENFVMNPVTLEAFCIDVYPPRLGFKTDERGVARRLFLDELLVDYPNGGRASKERWPALRRSYYEPVGMVAHFVVWFAACGVKNPGPQTLENATALFDKLGKLAIEELIAADLNADAQAVEISLTETRHIQNALSYRLGRVAKR